MENENQFQKSNVALIAIIHFFHDVYTAMLAPILPVLSEYYGFNLTFAGFLSVIQRIPTLFNPVVGILAERFKGHYFVIFAPAVTAISMSLIGIAPGRIFLALLILVSGISSSFFHVPSPVMMKKVAGKRIGMGMSFYMAGGEIARTLGPIIAIGAVELWGINGLFHLIPAGVLASLIFYFRLKDVSINNSANKGANLSTYFGVLREVGSVILVIAAITFLRAGMKSSLTFYLTTFLKGEGESLWFAGISLSLLQGAGVVGTLLAGSISDKIGRRTTMLISTTFTPIFFFFFLYSHGWVKVAALIVTGFFLFTSGPVLLAVVNDIKSRYMSLVNGVFMTTIFIIGAIVVMLIGYMGDRMPLLHVYKVAGFVAFLAIPLTFLLPKKEKEL